jgi:hypothetical protein
MQPDLTVLHRRDSFRQTSTDKKENKYFPRFAFLKISKSFAAHLHVAAFGGWASPITCMCANKIFFTSLILLKIWTLQYNVKVL